MTRLLSAIRRAADIDLVADTISLLVMIFFLLVAIGALTEASDMVTAWRLAR